MCSPILHPLLGGNTGWIIGIQVNIQAHDSKICYSLLPVRELSEWKCSGGGQKTMEMFSSHNSQRLDQKKEKRALMPNTLQIFT